MMAKIAAKSAGESAPAFPVCGVTIRDVAAQAGVSVATVSRVVNGKGPIRAETSRRVMNAVSAMQYIPHAAARTLSMRRSYTIGVLLPDLHGEFFSEVIRGVDLRARQHGYHLLVSGSHSDTAEMTAVLRALRGRVDGLIVMSPEVDPEPLFSQLRGDMPVVLLNSTVEQWPTITIDNYSGALAMVRHLVKLGHRRIAFITGPEGNRDAAERLMGYRDAMEAAVARPRELAGDFTERSGHFAALRALELLPRPTAIFAANDSMAIGALCALRECGLAVPDEMALAGFDDIPMARYLTPPLTTVHVAIDELGRRALDLLLNALKGTDSAAVHEILPASLVVRQSCGSGGHRPRRQAVRSSFASRPRQVLTKRRSQ